MFLIPSYLKFTEQSIKIWIPYEPPAVIGLPYDLDHSADGHGHLVKITGGVASDGTVQVT